MIGYHPAWGKEQPGMPIETAVYSGWLTNHLRCCWAQRETESRFSLLDQATPKNTAEVEEKQLAQSTQKFKPTNCFIRNNAGFVKRLQQPNKSQLKNLPSFTHFNPWSPWLWDITLKKRGGGVIYINQHQPTLWCTRDSYHSDDTSWSWPFRSPDLPRCWAPKMHLNLTYWYISSDLSQ